MEAIFGSAGPAEPIQLSARHGGKIYKTLTQCTDTLRTFQIIGGLPTVPLEHIEGVATVYRLLKDFHSQKGQIQPLSQTNC